jgi:pSer/pThr/pTyr-binding forkhead associated (FHA) protein
MVTGLVGDDTGEIISLRRAIAKHPGTASIYELEWMYRLGFLVATDSASNGQAPLLFVDETRSPGDISMRSVPDDRPDLTRPALIVTYGTTSRKLRSLERDVVVVGRAPGCDVALASPEVAPIHCVIARGPHGWRVRDCSGRGATRVNGTAVVDGPLKNGDTLQVGAFSFEAYLPATSEANAADAQAAAPVAQLMPEELPAAPDAEECRRLDIRARELAQYAEHLRRQEEEVNARLAHRHEEVAKAEAMLREQRAEVVRRMTEMARAGQSPKAKSDSASRQDPEALRSQLAMLKQELAGRDSIISGLRVRLEQLERDLAARRSIEEDREQLAHEREELAEQVALLEERRADLAEATREAELLAARERGQLARDRHELERMLEDFRYEQQQAPRKLEVFVEARETGRLTAAIPVSEPLRRTAVPTSGSHPGAAKWLDFGSRGNAAD